MLTIGHSVDENIRLIRSSRCINDALIYQLKTYLDAQKEVQLNLFSIVPSLPDTHTNFKKEENLLYILSNICILIIYLQRIVVINTD